VLSEVEGGENRGADEKVAVRTSIEDIRHVGSPCEQYKLEARKMLENGAESPASGAPMKIRNIILYERNRGALGTVYSEAASTQAEQSSGECLVQLPWCTVVSGQIDLNTGGDVRALNGECANPDEKANPLK